MPDEKGEGGGDEGGAAGEPERGGAEGRGVLGGELSQFLELGGLELVQIDQLDVDR